MKTAAAVKEISRRLEKKLIQMTEYGREKENIICPDSKRHRKEGFLRDKKNFDIPFVQHQKGGGKKRSNPIQKEAMKKSELGLNQDSPLEWKHCAEQGKRKGRDEKRITSCGITGNMEEMGFAK